MTNQEILKKAIEKAQKNGFKGAWENYGIVCEEHTEESDECCVYSTIFNHNFARAFFGIGRINYPVDHNEKYDERCTVCNPPKDWRYHLQQMVLEEEPFKYLEKFLND